jgi:hypothetical protein
MARKDFENKRVVRSWAARRVRQAFVESLRKEGYAQDGSRIEGRGLPLVGTVQFFPESTITKTKFKALVPQMDLVVREIIKRQSNQNRRGYKRFPEDEKKKFGNRGGNALGNSSLHAPNRSIKL